MPSGAVHAKGASVQVETFEGSGNFVKLKGVGNIKGPTLTADKMDATDQESPDDIQELVPGVKNLNPCTFPMNLFPADGVAYGYQRRVRSDNRTNRVRRYRVVEKDGEYEEFRAYVETWDPDRQIRGLRMVNITLQPVSASTDSNEYE